MIGWGWLMHLGNLNSAVARQLGMRLPLSGWNLPAGRSSWYATVEQLHCGCMAQQCSALVFIAFGWGWLLWLVDVEVACCVPCELCPTGSEHRSHALLMLKCLGIFVFFADYA
jgi:hypothetical protein